MYNMARRSISRENFLERLQDLPVVNDTLVKAGAIYGETKSYSILLRITLETAESTLGIFYSTTKSILQAFDKPIGTINGLACEKLENLKKDYPIIIQPTEEVLKQTKSAYNANVQPLVERLKSLTYRVIGLTKYSVDKIIMVTKFTVIRFEPVFGFGLNKVYIVMCYTMGKVKIVETAILRELFCFYRHELGEIWPVPNRKEGRFSYFSSNDDLPTKDLTDDEVTPLYAFCRLIAMSLRYTIIETPKAVLSGSAILLQNVRMPTNLMLDIEYYFQETKEGVSFLRRAINNTMSGRRENMHEPFVTIDDIVRLIALKLMIRKRKVVLWLRELAKSLNPFVPEVVMDALASPMGFAVARSPYGMRTPVPYDVTSGERIEPFSVESVEECKDDEKKEEEEVYHSPKKCCP